MEEPLEALDSSLCSWPSGSQSLIPNSEVQVRAVQVSPGGAGGEGTSKT